MKHNTLGRLSGLYLGDEFTQEAGYETGINTKRLVTELQVGHDKVIGDAQADPRHHGGADRVLHHFPREHYGQYRRLEMMGELDGVPAMGENISSVGVNESQINIGDSVRLGEVVLQVTQPRSPCFKLNRQFGHPEFALAMQTSGLCGWFYRVLTPGVIKQSDSLILLDRGSDISVAEAMKIYFLAEFDANAYDRLATCPGLALSWQQSLVRRLKNQRIEDWQMRLYGKIALN